MLRSLLIATLLLTGFASLPSHAADAPTVVPPFEELQNLIQRDKLIGKGDEAQTGKNVEVHYTGWLYDAKAAQLHGKQFDSSVGRSPFTFRLGAGNVIKGWDQGVVGMKVGGKRTLIIPGYLAYGNRGAGGGVIPPDAILVFDVELLKVK